MKNIRQLISFAAVLAGLVGPISATTVAAADAPPRLRVLFLGDDGHHKPADRFKQLEPVLAGRRIELDYTESLDSLNPAKLAGYDCLLIYANHTRISPSQEKALLDFVSSAAVWRAIALRFMLLHQLARKCHRVGQPLSPDPWDGCVQGNHRQFRTPDHEGPVGH